MAKCPQTRQSTLGSEFLTPMQSVVLMINALEDCLNFDGWLQEDCWKTTWSRLKKTAWSMPQKDEAWQLWAKDTDRHCDTLSSCKSQKGMETLCVVWALGTRQSTLGSECPTPMQSVVLLKDEAQKLWAKDIDRHCDTLSSCKSQKGMETLCVVWALGTSYFKHSHTQFVADPLMLSLYKRFLAHTEPLLVSWVLGAVNYSYLGGSRGEAGTQGLSWHLGK